MSDDIVPATKNWTWVLEKRCDDCGFDASVFDASQTGPAVRDVFRLFDERVNLMVGEDDPPFANWDQDATAIEDDYASQDAQTVAAQLAEAAQSLADRFDAVRADQWERLGFRSDGSVFTIESLGRYLMHDPVHHRWTWTPRCRRTNGRRVA